MAKESDINFSASELTKNNKQKLRKTLRKYGLSILLIQLILGSISTLLLSSIVVNIPERISLEINLSLFFSICGLICLIVSICSCFYFNKVIISQLSKTFLVQSIKSVATKVIKISIVSSFLGVCLTLFSIDILGWIILSRAISASQILFSSHNPYSYIFSTHIYALLASVNFMAANGAGLVGSIWISNQIEKLFFDSPSSIMKY